MQAIRERKMNSAPLLLIATLLSSAAHGEGVGNIWAQTSGPGSPLHYIAEIPVLQNTAQVAKFETYAPESLSMLLYPSNNNYSTRYIANLVNTKQPSSSKYSVIQQNRRSVNLSTSYVQEFAYIDTYSNIRRYEDTFVFPSIRMNLALPEFGAGLGGGYQNSQFGFGPISVRF